MSRIQRVFRLSAHPSGMVKESDFALSEEPVRAVGDGEMLVQNLWLSLDPAMRSWITGRRTYIEGVQVGQVMRGLCIGRVCESRRAEFSPGDLVRGVFDWQEYCVTDGAGAVSARKLPPGVPPTWFLGPLGLTGLTAYFGLLEVGRAVAGETVVVSGAAGATGSMAGQVARLKGCRVIGIAGGSEKCEWLTREAGFEAAIDYRAEKVRSRLRALCPRGLDVFFDNVGGATLEAALDNLALRARVVLCGAISQYNAEAPVGPRNYLNLLVKRARMEGFVVFDYFPREEEALAVLTPWLVEGRIRVQEDIVRGFEHAPGALLRLFEGRNHGKQLLQIAD